MGGWEFQGEGGGHPFKGWGYIGKLRGAWGRVTDKEKLSRVSRVGRSLVICGPCLSSHYVGWLRQEKWESGVILDYTYVCLGVNLLDSQKSERFRFPSWVQHCLGVKWQRQGSEIIFKVRIQDWDSNAEVSPGPEGHSLSSRFRVERKKGKETRRRRHIEGGGDLRSEIIVCLFSF